MEDKKIEIEIVREYDEDQIINMKEFQWQNEVMTMRDEAHEQLKAQGGSWFDYMPTVHNELVSHNRLRLTIKHKKELARP